MGNHRYSPQRRVPQLREVRAGEDVVRAGDVRVGDAVYHGIGYRVVEQVATRPSAHRDGRTVAVWQLAPYTAPGANGEPLRWPAIECAVFFTDSTVRVIRAH